MAQLCLRRLAPRGPVQRMFRPPIWLYRLQLGWLLGDRFLLLTHRGRVTGRLRQTVLEVVHHDRSNGSYLIASGFGARADWLRNLQASPHVLVESGGRRWEALAERLSVDEASPVFDAYARRHPRVVRLFARLLMGAVLRGSASDGRCLAERIPLVALRPLSGP